MLSKGWIGEKRAAINLWFSLSSKTYKRFHNLIIPSSNGTAQIDHLIISPFGLFVIETKNKKGWIFGSEDGAKWTQVIYSRKYKFQNPLRQAFRQKKVLAEFLGVDDSRIKTIIYFNGNCSFRTRMPRNVRTYGLGRYIKTYKELLFNEAELQLLYFKLKSFQKTSTLKKRDHLRSLRQRHRSKETCPRCGSALVVRMVKSGPRAGTEFYGCKSYPKCRYSRNK